MARLNRWLKKKVRQWLGLDGCFVASDIGLRQSAIVIVSRLDGGYVKIIDCHFNSAQDFRESVEMIKGRFGIPKYEDIRDLPRGIRI